MNNLIKKLPPTAEMIIVLLLAFGILIYNSTKSIIFLNSNLNSFWIFKYSNFSITATLIYEILVFIIIFYILKIRRWSISDFNLSFSYRIFGDVVLLFVVSNVLSYISFKIYEIFTIIDDRTISHVYVDLKTNFISVLFLTIVNPIFEEFILIGYLFKRIEKFNPAIIIAISVLIRQSYHTYQGWMSLFFIIPTGLVFGYYYYKRKKLLPIIIAHSLINIITIL